MVKKLGVVMMLVLLVGSISACSGKKSEKGAE